ncbi:MAG: phosphatidylglycerophosphatase A [Planctomycetes bacterium]|nr:phosphatidylglycerophosphatase A [Planctomycetota bacterium]NUQ34478.1 phosphatidylglycerophosphatase A [Planctomycetaceae bacterium]
MNQRLTYTIGSFFFAGASPFAPGTIGSLAAALAILGVEMLWSPPWWWTLVAAILVFFLGVWVGNHASTPEKPDPQWFVLDEVAGVLIAVTGQIALGGHEVWLTVLSAFIAFRVFDILKPTPIRQVERALKRGLGIMVDDALAGVFAWVVTWGALASMQQIS